MVFKIFVLVVKSSAFELIHLKRLPTYKECYSYNNAGGRFGNANIAGDLLASDTAVSDRASEKGLRSVQKNASFSLSKHMAGHLL